jgi:glucokinase
MLIAEPFRPRNTANRRSNDMPADRDVSRSRDRRRQIDVVVGMDIGGTKTAVQVISLARRRVLASDRLATPTSRRPRAFIATLATRVQKLLARPRGRGALHLRALGVAVPGQVDARGTVIGAGNLGWSRLPLRERFAAIFRIPVFVEHDANCAALAEHRAGRARRYSDFAFLALGTGVGAGIVLGGHLHRGVHHAAGELGDMILERPARRLGWRHATTLADAIGGRTIRNAARRSTGKKLHAAAALRAGSRDSRLASLLEEVADHVTVAIVNTSAVLDLQAVFLGGGSAMAGKPLLQRVRAAVGDALFRPPRVLLSALGEEAQLRGAALGAIDLLEPRRPGRT